MDYQSDPAKMQEMTDKLERNPVWEKVMWGIPTRGEPKEAFTRHFVEMKCKYPYMYTMMLEGGQGSHPVRNQLVKAFLETDKEWLLMVDDDTIPQGDPLCLAEQGFDICGGLVLGTFDGKGIPTWVIFHYDHKKDYGYTIEPTDANDTSVSDVDVVGTACIMIHRRVLEHPDMKIPFDLRLREDGTVKTGSDVMFSLRAKEAGFRVGVNLGLQCDHIVPVSLLNIKRAYESKLNEKLVEMKAEMNTIKPVKGVQIGRGKESGETDKGEGKGSGGNSGVDQARYALGRSQSKRGDKEGRQSKALVRDGGA